MDNRTSDYINAARIRKSGLRNLIAENIMSGEGIGTSIKKSISQKTKARITGIKEKFDPLNIASALVGRSKLGTALAGKLLGRHGDESRYFSNKGNSNKRGSLKIEHEAPQMGLARAVRGDNTTGKTRKQRKNPYYLSMAAGSTTDVRNGDTIANVFGKIYNQLRKDHGERETQRELEDNFREIREQKDSERHQELLEAILRGRKGTTTKHEEPKKGLLSFLGGAGSALLKGAGIVGAGIVGAVVGSKILKAFKKPATKAIEKSAEKIAEKGAVKTGEKIIEKKAAQSAAKATEKKIEKSVGKKVAQAASKEVVKKAVTKLISKETAHTILKKIPLLSIPAGAYFAASRVAEGDMKGAAAEMTSGVAGSLGPGGLAASGAIDIGLAARDVYKMIYDKFPEEEGPELSKAEKKDRLDAITSEISNYVQEQKSSFREKASDFFGKLMGEKAYDVNADSKATPSPTRNMPELSAKDTSKTTPTATPTNNVPTSKVSSLTQENNNLKLERSMKKNNQSNSITKNNVISGGLSQSDSVDTGVASVRDDEMRRWVEASNRRALV